MKFVICLQNNPLGDFSFDDLTIGRLYQVIADSDNQNMLRIIDDSGEDYLYPATFFTDIELSQQIAKQLGSALQ